MKWPGLTVPMVAVFSEGGSGGAEAISLADRRLMLSHGYYSVISPEGAAAIEGRLKPGQRATPELIERCATQLHITAEDNLQFGYIDRVIQEPSLGARRTITTSSAPCGRKSSGPPTRPSCPCARACSAARCSAA